MYNKLKTILKKDYYKSMLSKNKNNIKNTWALLKKAIGKENDKSNIPQSIQIQNEHVTDKTKIADSFNDYFTSIGKITGQNVPKTKTNYTNYLNTPVLNSIYLENVEPNQVSDIINKLKPKNSSGHDNISTKIVKASIVNIINPLTHIINLSLNSHFSG